MKHLKNYLGLSLLFVLVVTLAFASVACTDPGDNDDTTATTTDDGTTTAAETTGKIETTRPASDKPTYTITVVDEDGAPISGVVLQACVGNTCNPLGKTDADGKFSKKMVENDYEVSITKANGYEFDVNQKYYFEAGEEIGSYEVTIVLRAADVTTTA